MAKKSNKKSASPKKASKKFKKPQSKITKPSNSKLISSRTIFKRTWKSLLANRKTVSLIVIINFGISGLLFGLSNSNSDSIGTLLVWIIFSLSYILIAREWLKNNKKLPFKTALYNGPSQIVPFILLLMLVMVQSLPFAVGAYAFQIGVPGGVAVYLWEQILFGIVFFALSLPSFYWLTTTLFSLVVVAIPGVTPLQAWRAAKQLVRPFLIPVLWRVLVVLFLFVGLSIAAILLIAQFSNTISPGVFTAITQVASFALLPVFWFYIFELYSELLKYE